MEVSEPVERGRGNRPDSLGQNPVKRAGNRESADRASLDELAGVRVRTREERRRRTHPTVGARVDSGKDQFCNILKTTSSAELLLPIDRAAAFRCTFNSGGRSAAPCARAGWRQTLSLPSTRTLAADLGLSRGVVVECYEQLTAEGYLTSVRGSRTRVAEIRTEALATPRFAPGIERAPLRFPPGHAGRRVVSAARVVHQPRRVVRHGRQQRVSISGSARPAINACGARDFPRAVPGDGRQ